MSSARKRYYHRHFQPDDNSGWSKTLQRFLNSRAMLATLAVLTGGLLMGTTLLRPTPVLTSPIDQSRDFTTQFSFIPETLQQIKGTVAGAATSDKVVLGFLPYWELQSAQFHPELTDLAYFGITIGADGTYLRTQSDGEPDVGTRRSNSAATDALQRKLQFNDVGYHLVYKQFNNDDINSFLKSPIAQDRFVESVATTLAEEDIAGINMDIEYSGKNSQSLQEPYTELLRKLDVMLQQQYPNVTLSIDMYASAAKNEQIWHVENMTPYLDHIVIMAYDFHRRSSTRSGPVAPLFGDGDKWNGDVNSSVALFLEQAPAEKLLLGIPFYGYGWQTTESTAPSNTFPDTGFTMRYREVAQLLSAQEKTSLSVRWQDDSLSPYFTYQEDGNIYTVQYDDSRSLAYKISLVNELDLGGIAIWALGYEGETRELWDVIERKM